MAGTFKFVELFRENFARRLLGMNGNVVCTSRKAYIFRLRYWEASYLFFVPLPFVLVLQRLPHHVFTLVFHCNNRKAFKWWEVSEKVLRVRLLRIRQRLD